MSIIGRTTEHGQVTGHQNPVGVPYLIIREPKSPYARIATVVLSEAEFGRYLKWLGYEKTDEDVAAHGPCVEGCYHYESKENG